MAEPLLQAQIDIKAPVPTVWALISDFKRMPQVDQHTGGGAARRVCSVVRDTPIQRTNAHSQTAATEMNDPADYVGA